MERLSVGEGAPYDPIEAAIHVGRYALALPFARGRRVLDAACGEGYGTWLLAEAGAAEAVGVDVAEDAVATARASFRHDRLRFETCAGEALAEALPAGHFDMVVSIETIEHVADPEAFLRAIRQVATPDAVILLTCPNDHWYYGEAEGNPHHLHRYRLEEFQALATRILGGDAQWLLGSATLGFGAVPIGADAPGRPPRVVDIVTPRLELRVPGGDAAPTARDCAFFVGLWNAPERIAGAGAHHPLSMDAYRRMTAPPIPPRRVEELEAALEWHVARVRSLDESLRWHVERVRSLGESLDWHVARVANLAAEAETQAARATQLESSLGWHVARVANLAAEAEAQAARATQAEESRDWHRARLAQAEENLERAAARERALEQASATELLGRAMRAAPLFRIADRLRRRLADR